MKEPVFSRNKPDNRTAATIIAAVQMYLEEELHNHDQHNLRILNTWKQAPWTMNKWASKSHPMSWKSGF